ncbi:hypothetical protein [Oligoflexus tunisiensis]|uniref:hypothetical protein n=1 Tax=Oligoflexus tunisiensis TaxID=708132 RepID=UPI00114D28C0|nr:hypothetical protein [Oligoflexus tunisiensis]
MQLILNGTNQFFFRHGLRSHCRYIIRPHALHRGKLTERSLRLSVEQHRDALQTYIRHQGWNCSVDDMIHSIRVHSYDEGKALCVDLPHYLVDAQRGLLQVEASLSLPNSHETSPPPLPDAWHEDFHVFTRPLSALDLPPSCTFLQHFLRHLRLEPGQALRLAKTIDDSIPYELGFGNNFVTLDLSERQLQKLQALPKQIWKRYLDVATRKALGEPSAPEDMPRLPVVTSVGRLPHLAMPLPQLCELAQDLYMFPTAVPFSSLTITLYTLGSLVYCILSGVQDKALGDRLSLALLDQGYTVKHQGASLCRSKEVAKPKGFITSSGPASSPGNPFLS